MQVDTVVYFQVTDPVKYTYEHANPRSAIENLSITTLRNIVGDMDLDQTLTSRDIVNAKLREILDEATDKWGVKITRVEIKNIAPPRDILDAMEKQMRAERERRESILRAEGDKRSSILRAEGDRESAIRIAEGEKQSAILKAEGEAEAILAVQRAKAEGREVSPQTFGLDAMTRGCLGGTGFVFVSHVGRVQPCGYLELDCGSVREKTLSDLWHHSPIFRDLREFKKYEGKCGRCEYVRVCGGCRARAYESTGRYLAEEPLCLYRPGHKA